MKSRNLSLLLRNQHILSYNGQSFDQVVVVLVINLKRKDARLLHQQILDKQEPMVSEKRSKIKEFQWSERVLADGMGKKFMRITFFMF